jgi:hypothetical protein
MAQEMIWVAVLSLRRDDLLVSLIFPSRSIESFFRKIFVLKSPQNTKIIKISFLDIMAKNEISLLPF